MTSRFFIFLLFSHTFCFSLAARLIKIYFSFFTSSVKEGDVDNKMMSALLTGVRRAFPFASLDPEELDKQMETMHKLVHLVSFNISIQALTLLYQVMDSREEVTDRFYSALYKKILDPDLANSNKILIFLNLLYKAIKADESVARVKAFIKRLLQVISYQPSHLVCGVLYLISELVKARPEIKLESTVNQKKTVDTDQFQDDSEDEEHFVDAPDDEAEGEGRSGGHKQVKSGWTFKAGQASHKPKTEYDPVAWNPLYCGADKSVTWELSTLAQHFHPTAALFTENVMNNVITKYPGDPLSDFTISRFLDRFVFRNPKKNPEKYKPTTVHGKNNIYKPAGIKAVAPDSKDFYNRDIGSIPNDELFIYKYFQEKIQRKGVKTDDDNASVTSEEFNNFLDSMGGRARDFDDEDDDLDFAGGLGDEAVPAAEELEEEEEEDNEENLGPSDEEPEGLDGEDDADFKDLSSNDEDSDMDVDNSEEGFGGEDDEFDEEAFGEDDEDMASTFKAPKQKKAKMKFAKFDPHDLSSVLADAEEFSNLIEENDDAGTSSSVVNRDKASKRQLHWEKDNEDFMKGQKWKSKKKPFAGVNNKHKFKSFKAKKGKSKK